MTASQSPFAEKSDGSLIAKIRQGDEEAASTELFDCQSERPTGKQEGQLGPQQQYSGSGDYSDEFEEVCEQKRIGSCIGPRCMWQRSGKQRPG